MVKKDHVSRETLPAEKTISEVAQETKLSPQQVQFVEEYLKNYNITQAYYTAYEAANDNVAAASGSKLLRTPKVYDYLIKREKEKTKLITDDYIIDRIKHISENSSKDSNKLRGLELLGKAKGIFKESNAPQVAIFQQFNGMEDQMIRDLESQSDSG